MSSYVTLNLNTNMYQQIIDALMSYVTGLDNYYNIVEIIHLIDALEGMYQYDVTKQNKEFKQYQEYKELFEERFKASNGNLNDAQIKEYVNFGKVNQVIEDYKEDGVLVIFDTEQQFFLVLDLINSMGENND